MLDDRPILQKSLIGLGAFAFVFFAAMGGTAFMISGGIDLNGREHSQAVGRPDYVNLVQDTWSDWAAPQAQASTYAPATYTPPAPTAPPPDAAVASDASYASADLADSDTPAVRQPTEEQIAREIDAQYAAQEEERQAANEYAMPDESPVKDGEY